MSIFTNEIEGADIREVEEDIKGQYRCEQCGKEMNVIEWCIGHVCHSCCQKNAEQVAGVKRGRK